MTGFTKLFSTLIFSTVWRGDMHVKVVWITMLALADRNGRVLASVPGLADASRVSLEQCIDALKQLSDPDEWSRTKTNEGKRIEEIDGGWRLLNYLKYREMRDADERRIETREAVRRHRAKSVSKTSDSKQSKPRKAQAEAEAEADTEADPEKIKNVSSAPLKGRAAEPAELERVTPFLTFPTIGKNGHEWTLSEERLAEWGALYPGLDLHSEARKALAWVGSSPSHRKTADGMPRFLVNWFNRATNRRVTTTVRHERRGAKSIAEQNFAGLAEDLRHDK